MRHFLLAALAAALATPAMAQAPVAQHLGSPATYGDATLIVGVAAAAALSLAGVVALTRRTPERRPVRVRDARRR